LNLSAADGGNKERDKGENKGAQVRMSTPQDDYANFLRSEKLPWSMAE